VCGKRGRKTKGEESLCQRDCLRDRETVSFSVREMARQRETGIGCLLSLTELWPEAFSFSFGPNDDNSNNNNKFLFILFVQRERARKVSKRKSGEKSPLFIVVCAKTISLLSKGDVVVVACINAPLGGEREPVGVR